jgi:hypothetical protein
VKYVCAEGGISGSFAYLARLKALLDRLDNCDELEVWKLDLLGRSTRIVL